MPRYVLFWLSFDRTVVPSRDIHVEYDQMTPVAAGSKFLQEDESVFALHQMMHVQKRFVFFCFFSLFSHFFI